MPCVAAGTTARRHAVTPSRRASGDRRDRLENSLDLAVPRRVVVAEHPQAHLGIVMPQPRWPALPLVPSMRVARTLTSGAALRRVGSPLTRTPSRAMCCPPEHADGKTPRTIGGLP